VGDIIDGWKLTRIFAWNDTASFVVRRVLGMLKRGTRVYYVTGNHDEFLRVFSPHTFGFINDCEQFVAGYTLQQGCTGVVCGHIHVPAIHRLGGIDYYNCGDWVEHCTALIEHLDGRIELVGAAADAGATVRVDAGESTLAGPAGIPAGGAFVTRSADVTIS